MIDIHNLTIILSLAFILGTILGSFVTMASYRLVRAEDLIFKPSYCPSCNTSLTFADLFPVLSWFFQRGKCRHCHTKISARYPLIECSLGLIFAGLTYCFGVSIDTLFYMILATELLILVVTDLEHFIIPDEMQLALFITAIAYRIYQDSPFEGIFISISSGLALGLALHYGYLILRKKDALGWGDVKFLAVVGAWLPLHDFVPFLFLSGVIGTITGLLWRFKNKGEVFPFGPALACSLFINVLIPGIIERITL